MGEQARTILITGGMGFIGSHVVEYWLKRYPHDRVVNLDALTYAGNPDNLEHLEGHPRYVFVKGSVVDKTLLEALFRRFDFDGVLHLAAESHVDRSIERPEVFLETNILGTFYLLEASRAQQKRKPHFRFHHISTDEVFGSLEEEGYFEESTAYDPHSPYAASKASSDHFVRAYFHTYGLNVVLSNCSNNFGPRQFPEKLIPKAILSFCEGKPFGLYGSGLNVRDWLYVEDHVHALDLIYHKGKRGESYNVGGSNECTNRVLVEMIADAIDRKKGRAPGFSRALIAHVADRPGHDARYAICAEKIERELNWKPRHTFSEAMGKTIDWYFSNYRWLERIVDESYLLKGSIAPSDKSLHRYILS